MRRPPDARAWRAPLDWCDGRVRTQPATVCRLSGHTPADFPSPPHAASWRRRASASRSRSNEPPRQIEDGAHKLLRAAASCACLELACTQTSLEAGPPSTVPIACACGLLNARLATQLDQGAARAVRPPYAGLEATVEALQAMSKAMYTAVRVRSALCLQLKSTHEF